MRFGSCLIYVVTHDFLLFCRYFYGVKLDCIIRGCGWNYFIFVCKKTVAKCGIWIFQYLSTLRATCLRIVLYAMCYGVCFYHIHKYVFILGNLYHSMERGKICHMICYSIIYRREFSLPIISTKRPPMKRAILSPDARCTMQYWWSGFVELLPGMYLRDQALLGLPLPGKWDLLIRLEGSAVVVIHSNSLMQSTKI